MIPTVSKDIFYPIFESACRKVDSQQSWMEPILDEIEQEQPELYDIISEFSRCQYDAAGEGALIGFNVGVCIMYKAIKNQLECKALESI